MLDEIAEALHTIKCNYNHCDQCDWMYDHETRTSWAWKKYREQAQALLAKLPDMTQESILKVLRAVP